MYIGYMEISCRSDHSVDLAEVATVGQVEGGWMEESQPPQQLPLGVLRLYWRSLHEGVTAHRRQATAPRAAQGPWAGVLLLSNIEEAGDSL